MLIVLLFGLSFLTGIIVGSVSNPVFPDFIYALPLFAVFFRKKSILLLFFAFLFGFWRAQFYEENVLRTDYLEGFQTLGGTVSEEPEQRDDSQTVVLTTQQGKVLLELSLYKDLHYGDHLKVQGDLELTSLQNEEGDASYQHYLQRQGIVALLEEADVLIIEPGPPSFKKLLYVFKAFIEAILVRLFPEPEASFADGLLLGSRRGIPVQLTEAFQKVGLYHIVAISGSNISLVIATFFALFAFLPFKHRIWISCFFVGFFVLLVGATSTVIRAALMGSLTLWGLYFGRKSAALFALFWSVLILVLWNPYMLLYDIGFQLSVASTFGLLTIQPILKERVDFFSTQLPSWVVYLQEAFLLSLSAQIATFPFMVYYFGRFSWISPFVNVLATPLIPLAMLFSGLSLLCPFVLPFAWSVLFLIESLALLTASVPGIEFSLSLSFDGFLFALFLELFCLLLLYKSKWIPAFFRGQRENFSKGSVPPS